MPEPARACAAPFGRQEATQLDSFVGMVSIGKRIEIRYMDFWKVSDGRIEGSRVRADFPHVPLSLALTC